MVSTRIDIKHALDLRRPFEVCILVCERPRCEAHGLRDIYLFGGLSGVVDDDAERCAPSILGQNNAEMMVQSSTSSVFCTASDEMRVRERENEIHQYVTIVMGSVSSRLE